MSFGKFLMILVVSTFLLVGLLLNHVSLSTLQSVVAQHQSDDARERFVALIKSRDLLGLEDLLKELTKSHDGESPYDQLADICSAMNSYDFKNNRQYLLARTCSKGLLNRDDLPVILEFRMIKNLQGIEEYRSGIKAPDSWEDDRRERVNFLAKLWERVEMKIDRTFELNDINNRPAGNVPVPGPYPPGIRPSEIKEPEIREKYLQAIALNKVKALRFNEQIQLHRVAEQLLPFAEKMLIDFYSIDPIDISEMETQLRLFELDSETKTRIRKAIDSRRRQ